MGIIIKMNDSMNESADLNYDCGMELDETETEILKKFEFV